MLNDANDATPPGTFTLLQIHVGDDYGTAWGSSRWTFYFTGEPLTPTVFLDGACLTMGADSIAFAYTSYMACYNGRQAVATDVTIQLTGRLLSTPTGEFKAKVGIEAGGTGKTLRIYFAQVLDHYPASPTYSRYCFIQAATALGSEDIVNVSPGTYQTVIGNFTLSGASLSDPNNVKIVAWAQDGVTKEIWQAATVAWPTQVVGDFIVNMDDVPLFTLALTDRVAYQALYPDTDVDIAGDTNGDGLFDGADINSFADIVINDHTPPTPNPMTWSIPPAAISTSSITMTATTATDQSGVEYYFTASGPDSHSSGWMLSPFYTDTDLQTNQSYSYKVKARDQSPQHNETTNDGSSLMYLGTFIETPSGLTVDTTTSTSIQVTAAGPFTRPSTGSSGFYFEVTDLDGTPVGTGSGVNKWTAGTLMPTTATASSLTPNTTYRFRVKARNQYGLETPYYPAADYVLVTTLP